MKNSFLFKLWPLFIIVVFAGCQSSDEVAPTPPSPPAIATRYVKGVVSDKDTGEKLKGIKLTAWECSFCLFDCDGLVLYAERKTQAGGFFDFHYIGPQCFDFYPHLTTEYKHYSINGVNRDSVFSMPSLHVLDTLFVEVELW